MRKVLKNKKGMTLIEILIGSLLFAIVTATATAVLAPMMQAFSRANDLAEYNILLDNVGNKLVSEISQASEIKSEDPLRLVIQGNIIEYTVHNGSLERNGLPVFPQGFYEGKSIGFQITADAPDVIIAVTVFPSDEGRGVSAATITRTYAVKPLIMIQD